jgi:hypothetical protein
MFFGCWGMGGDVMRLGGAPRLMLHVRCNAVGPCVPHVSIRRIYYVWDSEIGIRHSGYSNVNDRVLSFRPALGCRSGLNMVPGVARIHALHC